MNDFLEDLLRFLTRNPNLGLLVSALLTSTAVVCVAWAMALQLQRRSARARSLIWRITMAMLLVVAVWRFTSEAAPPVAVVEWRVTMQAHQINAAPLVLPETPVLILPEKSWSQRGLMWLESWGLRLWLGAAGALLLWKLARAFAGLVWLRKNSEEAPPLIEQQGERAGAPSSMRCRLAQRLQSPMLTGLRKPVIWLPQEAAGWDEKRLDAVMHHELAHFQRSDVFWKWLGQCAVCLWWWQPLSWLAQRRLRFETEQAADDVAVLASGDTREYARTLVEIAAGIPGRLRPTAGVTMFGGESIQQRVRELMKTNQWRGRIGIGAMSLIAVVAVILAVLAATKVEFKPKVPLYQSEAKLVAGSSLLAAGNNWQAQQADHYGTIIETIESAEMKRRALERVRALNPNLKDKDVEILAAQVKGTTMFGVQAVSTDGKYAKIFLDALLDEFIAFRQSVREQAGGKDLHLFLQETVKMQRVMEERNRELAEFRMFNNITAITQGNNQTAEMLSKLTAQMAEQNMILADLELDLSNIPAAVTQAQVKVSDVQPSTQTERDYIQTQSELRRLENELKYLLENHKPDNLLVIETKEKAAKVRFLLNALVEPIREEMSHRAENTRRRITVLKKVIVEKEAQALDLGSKIAQYLKLEKAANAAKEAFQKLFEKAEKFQDRVGGTDFVAIQQRARPAIEIVQSGLIPIWRLWKSEPKPAAEGTPVKPVTTQKKEPVKAAS
ncbi:MAG: hypothetical protein B7Z37_21440 [Verrucomicrobia bacterium 12-59-8]|nr:MAG: hypothetical protein B7Z37_21440 [Verrucomicrobia bacterium 12-59-8]